MTDRHHPQVEKTLRRWRDAGGGPISYNKQTGRYVVDGKELSRSEVHRMRKELREAGNADTSADT